MKTTSVSAQSNKVAAPGTDSRAKAATNTVDLSLQLLEYLVASGKPVGVTDIAKVFQASKATVYRHLQAMVKHGFARQDEETNRYEAGIKLLVLGEAMRERFGILSVARSEMARLREATGHAVSLCAFTNDEVITLEILQGRTIVDFGVRPGTKMDLHATAHGKVALAFGPAHLLQSLTPESLFGWTSSTTRDVAALKKQITSIRKNGWATAANEIVPGVNALAAPVFDHREAYAGAVAIIGSTHLIEARPSAELIGLVTHSARQISRELGSTRSHTTGEAT